MSMLDGMIRLFGTVTRLCDLFTPEQVRRRRLAARAKMASKTLVRVGDIALPFEDIVAAGLAGWRVPRDRIHSGVQDCIRQAVEAADTCRPAVRLRDRIIVEEVTLESVLGREDSDEYVPFRRIGLARGLARDADRRRQRPRI